MGKSSIHGPFSMAMLNNKMVEEPIFMLKDKINPQNPEWNQHPFDPEWCQANRRPRPHLIPSPSHEDSTEASAVTGRKRVRNHHRTKLISKGSCRGNIQTIIEEIKRRSNFELCFVKFPDGRILFVVDTPLAE